MFNHLKFINAQKKNQKWKWGMFCSNLLPERKMILHDHLYKKHHKAVKNQWMTCPFHTIIRSTNTTSASYTEVTSIKQREYKEVIQFEAILMRKMQLVMLTYYSQCVNLQRMKMSTITIIYHLHSLHIFYKFYELLKIYVWP